MSRRTRRVLLATLSCLLVVTASTAAQTDECVRVREARRQAENQLMVLLASPLLTKGEIYGAAAAGYDPWPAAQARRQGQVQQMQQLIAQFEKREREMCSVSDAPTPGGRGRRPSENGQSGTPPAPPKRDAPACPWGEYWNSVREQCVKIGE